MLITNNKFSLNEILNEIIPHLRASNWPFTLIIIINSVIVIAYYCVISGNSRDTALQTTSKEKLFLWKLRSYNLWNINIYYYKYILIDEWKQQEDNLSKESYCYGSKTARASCMWDNEVQTWYANPMNSLNFVINYGECISIIQCCENAVTCR